MAFPVDANIINDNIPVSIINSPQNLDAIAIKEGTPISVWQSFSNITLTGPGQTLGDIRLDQTGAFPVPPAFFPYIKKVTFMASRDVRISVRTFNTPSTIFKGVNDNVTPNSFTRINETFGLKAGVKYSIDSTLFYWAWMTPITIVVTGYDTSDTSTLTLDVNFDGYSVSKNPDMYAPNTALWIGDSITFGTGSDHLENTPDREHFSLQVTRFLREKGYRFKACNKGVSSATSSSLMQAKKWGFYEINQASLIIVMIGANDANNLGSGGLGNITNQNIFRSNIQSMISYFQKRYKGANILMMGSTPSADTPTENLIQVSRNILQDVVTTLNLPYIKYVSLANAFDRLNPANYLPSDTIHPVAQNAISAAIINYLSTLNWYE